jgi:predicted dehydrogenase
VPEAALKMAIAGLGVMGRDHLKNALTLQQEGLVRLVGLADVEVERARLAGGGAEEVPVFADPQALLEETRPDFVVVATPHPSHEEVTLAAAERGVHVLCEKPIAHTVGAADRMIEGCRRAGVLLGIDFNQRTTPAYIRAHQLLAGGELGDLYRVSFVASGWYRTQAYYDSGGWRGTWDGEGGGVVMNQAPHHLDLYCWLAGPPRRVKATALTRFHEIDVENTVAALLEHGDRPAGSSPLSRPPARVDTFYTTTAEWPGRTEFLFAGERGRLLVAERQLRLYRMERSLREELLQAPHGSKPAGAWEEIEVPPAPPGTAGHLGLLRQFAQAVRSGRQEDLIASGEDGRHALELANAMLLAAYRDRSVELPIDRGAYEALLQELAARAGGDEGQKRWRAGQPEQVLATLPEGT